MQPKVSVIIPIYNASKYLRECLDSVAYQSLKDIQVIMIDDGSTDDSSAICREYVERYSCFEYYYKENGGSASARNVGLDYAMGDYIGFVDSDDIVKPTYFETLYIHAKNHDADIVYLPYAAGKHNAEYYENPINGRYSKSQMLVKIIPNVLPHVNQKGTFRSMDWGNCSRLVRRSIVERNHIRYFTGSRRCEDLAFIFECTIAADAYYVADDCDLYYYRPSETSKSRHYTKKMWKSISALMVYIRELAEKSGTDLAQIHYNECVFYFCCMSMKNEILGAPDDQLLMNEKEILNDHLCKKAILIDSSKLNSQYRAYYKAISSGDEKKAVRMIRYYEWKKKNISPIIGRMANGKLLKRVYKKSKRHGI